MLVPVVTAAAAAVVVAVALVGVFLEGLVHPGTVPTANGLSNFTDCEKKSVVQMLGPANYGLSNFTNYEKKKCRSDARPC